MTTLAAPTGNEIQDELAASYTRGTDTTITLDDGASFVNSTPLGHVVRITDGVKWCLVIYDNKTDADTLEMSAVDDYALAINLGGGAAVDEEFAIGSTVELVCAADEIAQLFTDVAARTEKATLTTKGDIYAASAASTPERLGVGADGYSLTALSGETTGLKYAPLEHKNILINGDFAIGQRQTNFTAASVPANSDDTYLLDRWKLLSDGNDIVDVYRDLGNSGDGYGCWRSIVATQDKKWGLLQIVEAKNAARFIGQTVSLSFKAKLFTGDTNTLLRAAVLAWDSTADAVTSDVVDAWGDEGTNPTLVANWTAENTPAALTAMTDAYQTYKIEGISIDTASATNIAVFIWSDDKTNAASDAVYITDVQLELGSVATPFEVLSHGTKLSECQRYYEKSYDETVPPGTVTSTGMIDLRWPATYTAITMTSAFVFFKKTKRVNPTVVLYNPDTGTISKFSDNGDDISATGITTGVALFNFYVTTFTATAGEYYRLHFTADAEL